jgi:TPR repeat protein
MTSPAFSQTYNAEAEAKTEHLVAIGEECSEALEAGDIDRATVLSYQFVEAREIQFNAQAGAEHCLEGATGGEWLYVYTEKRFVSQDLLEARAALADFKSSMEQEQAQAVAALAVLIQEGADLRRDAAQAQLVVRTHNACLLLLQRDEVAALTNPVCHDSFMRQGTDGL